MDLKIEKIENDKQKIIITGLIVSDEFCKQIIPILLTNKTLMGSIFSSFSKIVSNWCIDYYNQYKKAPKKFIQDIYQKNKDDLEEDLIDLIADFLNGLSNNYSRQENYNEQYVIDQSIKFLREFSLKNLETQIKILRKQGNIEEAEKVINDYREINKATKDYEVIDFLQDFNQIKEAIYHTEQKLFTMQGCLGRLMGYFLRGDLVSFIAPAKRGKSWDLIEVAQRAILCRLRVLFISFEMSKMQVLKRFCQSVTGQIQQNDEIMEEPEEIQIPYFKFNDEKNKYEIKHRIRKRRGLNFHEVKSKIKAMKMQIKAGALKILCAPMNSMTTTDISNVIDDMVLDGFVPDVIISDYADITLSSIRGEYRHQLDNIWKGYKNIAQDKHCVVITATHSNKSTFDKDIKQKDASEDIRKMNHVSIMVSLDQTNYEKSIGVMRMGVLAHRHKDFNPRIKVIVLENKKIGRCYLDSRFRKEVIDYNKMEKEEE